MRGTPAPGWSMVDLGPDGPGPYRLLRSRRAALVHRFEQATFHPEAAERAALARVLDAARGTAFERVHGLASVRTIDDWRRAVPIRPWSAFADDLRRVAAGESRALVRHPILSFVRTSGTTAEPKLLPVTEPWAREVAEAQQIWTLAMARSDARLATGRVLVSVGRVDEGRTASGHVVGSNTGRMAAAQPWWTRVRYAVPAAVAALPDPSVRRYVALRIALGRDVRLWTTANPTTILAGCRALAQHAESLRADLADGTLTHGPAADLPWRARAALWPHLRRRRLPADLRPAKVWDLAAVTCWKGGAVGAFAGALPVALGADVPVWEPGISASEGFFAVALDASWRGGVAWLPGHLLEFVPAEGGEPVGAAEVEVGRTYRLVISTTAGLYRYDLDDHVRVAGWWNSAPQLVFVGKGSDVSSITGEKLTAEQVGLAMGRAVGTTQVVGFSLALRLGDVPRYTFVAEGPIDDAAGHRLDEALRDVNLEYASKRADGRLGPVDVLRVPDGAYGRLRDERLAAGAAEGQVKDPVFLDAAALARLTG